MCVCVYDCLLLREGSLGVIRSGRDLGSLWVLLPPRVDRGRRVERSGLFLIQV
jgi:hypothetical protein